MKSVCIDQKFLTNLMKLIVLLYLLYTILFYNTARMYCYLFLFDTRKLLQLPCSTKTSANLWKISQEWRTPAMVGKCIYASLTRRRSPANDSGRRSLWSWSIKVTILYSSCSTAGMTRIPSKNYLWSPLIRYLTSVRSNLISMGRYSRWSCNIFSTRNDPEYDLAKWQRRRG